MSFPGLAKSNIYLPSFYPGFKIKGKPVFFFFTPAAQGFGSSLLVLIKRVNSKQYLTEEEKRFVIREHLKEIRKIKGQLDKKVDTEHYLMVEIEVKTIGWAFLSLRDLFEG